MLAKPPPRRLSRNVRRPARFVAQRPAPTGGCRHAAATAAAAAHPSAARARPGLAVGNTSSNAVLAAGSSSSASSRARSSRCQRPARGGERAEVGARPPGARALPGEWHFRRRVAQPTAAAADGVPRVPRGAPRRLVERVGHRGARADGDAFKRRHARRLARAGGGMGADTRSRGARRRRRRRRRRPSPPSATPAVHVGIGPTGPTRRRRRAAALRRLRLRRRRRRQLGAAAGARADQPRAAAAGSSSSMRASANGRVAARAAAARARGARGAVDGRERGPPPPRPVEAVRRRVAARRASAGTARREVPWVTIDILRAQRLGTSPPLCRFGRASSRWRRAARRQHAAELPEPPPLPRAPNNSTNDLLRPRRLASELGTALASASAPVAVGETAEMIISDAAAVVLGALGPSGGTGRGETPPPRACAATAAVAAGRVRRRRSGRRVAARGAPAVLPAGVPQAV